MMLISTLPRVYALSQERKRLADMLASLRVDDVDAALRIVHQDADLRSAIRPALVCSVETQLRSIASELRAAGVELDTEPS